MNVTHTPLTPDLAQATCGGELGATLFVAGFRIFAPEHATAADYAHAIEALQRLAACLAENITQHGFSSTIGTQP